MSGAGQRQARELRILTQVAEALNSSPDVRQALEKTLALIADSLKMQAGWVWLRDPETGEFYNAAALNLPPYLQIPVRMTGYPCWCIEAFQNGQLTPKNLDVLECSRLRAAVRANDSEATRGLHSHASVPLTFQDKPLGILNVTAPAGRELTKEELRLLSTIAYQVGIAIERARLAEASARLARAEERTRIARDIHDTLAQGLTGIGLHIEGALTHLETDPARARERLLRALAMTRESLEEARHSVLNLRAAPPAGKPLPEALNALARSVTAETGIRISVRVVGNAVLPASIEMELYRIAQEALTNVRRHAAATEAEIVLRVDIQSVRLLVRDNGRGFAPSRSSETGGHGLLGMRERARLLGGNLRIASAPGRGARLVVRVPLPSAEKEP